jgi:hypothetical protein
MTTRVQTKTIRRGPVVVRVRVTTTTKTIRTR